MIKYNGVWIGHDKAYGFYAKHCLGNIDSHIGINGNIQHPVHRVDTLSEIVLMIRRYKEKQRPIQKKLYEKQIEMIRKKIEDLDKEEL